jgi:predicted kinase
MNGKKSKVRFNKPLLIMLYGFPGAGKTYFSRNLSEDLECAHVQSDRIRHELFEEPRFDKQENEIIMHLMDYMTEEFLSAGISVIYDTNLVRKSQRVAIRNMANKKHAQTLLVWFQIDPDTAFKRLNKRDRRKADDKFALDYSEEDFRRYASHMQHPEPTEKYVVLSGKHTYESQKSAIFKKFMDMGLMSNDGIKSTVAMPGMINLVPNSSNGRVDMTRRNISIR